jgi:hypothetical protein
VPWALAGVGALLWSVAHLVAHGPRGWPMEVPGEWDLLLTALAIRAGAAPDAAVGTLHGNELGSYVVAGMVAELVRLGADVVVAAKWVALAFGAGSAAVVAWLGAWLAARSGQGARGAAVSGLVSASMVAAAWPGLHFELAGVNGRTPESLLPQVLAVAVLVSTPRQATGGALVGRALLVGALLSLGWLLSPVTLWTAGACGVAAMVQLRSGAARATAAGAAVAGLMAPLILFAACVPAGGEGLSLFLMEQFGGGLGVTATESGARAGVTVVARVAGALEGGAHNPALTGRGLGLAGIGWALLAGMVGSVAAAVRARTMGAEALAAGIGLSWLIPLVLLPTDKWFYPLAYRYWVLLLALGIAVLPALLGRLGSGGAVGRVALVVATLLCGTTLPRSIVAPAPSRAEALVSTGAHRMNPRPGRDRHAAFRALVPHAPAAARPALAEGYGMALGGDFAVDVQDERAGVPPWVELRDDLDAPAFDGFVVGVGCGVTALRELPQGAVAMLAAAEGRTRDGLLWGLGRCGATRLTGPLAEDAAFAAGAANRRFHGLGSAVPNPAEAMPPRW